MNQMRASPVPQQQPTQSASGILQPTPLQPSVQNLLDDSIPTPTGSATSSPMKSKPDGVVKEVQPLTDIVVPIESVKPGKIAFLMLG